MSKTIAANVLSAALSRIVQDAPATIVALFDTEDRIALASALETCGWTALAQMVRRTIEPKRPATAKE